MAGSSQHKFVSSALVGLVLVILLGCGNDSGRTVPETPWGPWMRIRPIGDQRRDHITIEIQVHNEGTEPFAWDREFSVFMRWFVTTTSGEFLEPQSINRVDEKKPAGSWKSQFVIIAPGESISRRVELTKSFRKFVYSTGWGTRDGQDYEILNSHHEVAKFVIPEDIGTVWITAEYEGPTQPYVFSDEFGVSPSKIQLLTERLRSNEVRISFLPPDRP